MPRFEKKKKKSETDSPARTNNTEEQKAQAAAHASPGASAAYPTKTPVKGFYTTSLGNDPQGDEAIAKRIYNPCKIVSDIKH